MKVFKVELMIIDFDGLGEDGIADVLVNTHYPNHCINPDVKSIESRDIGEWSDDNLLNHHNTSDAEYHRLFSKPE